MKSEDTNIQNKVNEAMGLLDNLKKEMPDPFFITRLQAKIEALESRPELTPRFFTSYILKPVFVIALIVINIAIYTYITKSDNNYSSRDSEIENIADLYAFDQSSYYMLTSNLNNNE